MASTTKRAARNGGRWHGCGPGRTPSTTRFIGGRADGDGRAGDDADPEPRPGQVIVQDAKAAVTIRRGCRFEEGAKAADVFLGGFLPRSDKRSTKGLPLGKRYDLTDGLHDDVAGFPARQG